MSAEDGAAFLPVASGGSDLLPTGTQVFSSSVRFSRPVYIISAVSVLAAFALLAACASPSLSDSARWALLGTAIGCAVLGGGVALLLARRDALKYEEDLQSGVHDQGVFVFASGDVVIRYHGIFGEIDQTIEAAYLSRAQVERRCSLLHGRPRNFLKLYYLKIDAKPASIQVCETDVRDSVIRICEYINLSKSAQNTAFSFGGIDAL